MSDESILELVSKVDEFVEMSELFSDEDLDQALSMVIKLTMKPDVPPQTAARLIVQLESIAAKLHIVASYYKNVTKPKVGELEYQKKNMYFSIAEAIRAVTAGLKYQIRGYSG